MTIKQRIAMKLYKMIQEKIELNYVRIVNFVANGLDSENEAIKERSRLFLKILNDPIYTLDKQRLFCATWFRKDLGKWLLEDDILRFFKGVEW